MKNSNFYPQIKSCPICEHEKPFHAPSNSLDVYLMLQQQSASGENHEITTPVQFAKCSNCGYIMLFSK